MRKFWKYFFGTFKQGRYLLATFLTNAVLMCIVTVLANLLNTPELTYLNAFLAINYFGTMISFGVSQSTNIFVNQNISSKHKVRQYTSAGFYLSIAALCIFESILIAFPQFMMETLGDFVPNDYTFYYIMCGYLFLNGISNYMQDMLQALQKYKIEFFCEIMPIVVTIIGFVVLYFAGIYYLNYIAIVYIISGLVSVTMSAVSLFKDKRFKINIYDKLTIRFTKRQWAIMLTNFFTEVIWQIGYFATSMFLLRLNDGIFNTYAYLENVLDIFNGFLFAYIGITCIRITRCLGRNQFKKAQQHAKNSLIGTVVIWAGYFIVSVALIYPLAIGANNEYFYLMFYAVPCYAFIHLVRFLAWNFSSYMLRLGGKCKNLLILEIFDAIYLFVLCALVKYIPVNIFLAYGIILVPELIKLVICYIIYKREKWLANINENKNSLNNKIKCVIFNFDDTLYYGINWAFWYRMVGEWFDKHFENLSFEEKKTLLKKYGVRYRKQNFKLSDNVLCKLLIETEGSAKPWLEYRDKLEMHTEEKKGKAISKKELKRFAKLGKLYIVSNSRLANIKQTAEYYNIDLSLFEKIYVNDYDTKNTSKDKYFKEIMYENNLQPENVLVIGSSKQQDILPAKRLKMQYYRCKNGFIYLDVIE